MTFIGYSNPKILIADEGKHIRAINDVYEAAHVDEEGNEIPEHFPYYSDMIFVASDTKSLEECQSMYVEEPKE